MRPELWRVDAFVEGMRDAGGDSSAIIFEQDAWEQALAEAFANARARWCEIEFDEASVVRRLGGVFAQSSLPHRLDSLAAVRVPELTLAWTAGCGDPRALARIEREYGEDIDAPLRTIRDPHLRCEDLAQIVRTQLFVGSATTRPAIAAYNGVGRLSAWLRVTVRRMGFNATRRVSPRLVSPEAQPELVERPLVAPTDPELAYLRVHYGEHFRAAFAEAVSDLTHRDRTLLKMSYGEQVRVRTIARMYGVHHATAARWVGAARETLIRATRARLAQRFELESMQLESIIALIRSRIEDDVAEILREPRSLDNGPVEAV